jgi:trehalose 6-phosphate phosphatase
LELCALVRDRLDAFAAKYPGVVIEDRGRSLAAQFGRAPQCRARLQSALRDLVAGHPDVEMMPTREAFEIRPRAVDKRMAVEWFMRTTAFSGRLPIFIGDGVADEAGFDAVRSFAGCAIEVGASARGREMRWIACLDDLGSWLAALDRTSRRRQ